MIDTPSTTATATWSRPLSQALAYCHQDCIAFGLSCYLIKSGAAVRRGAPDSHPTESTNWIRLGPAIKYDLLTGYWLRRMRCVYTLDLWPAFFFLSLPPPPPLSIDDDWRHQSITGYVWIDPWLVPCRRLFITDTDQMVRSKSACNLPNWRPHLNHVSMTYVTDSSRLKTGR